MAGNKSSGGSNFDRDFGYLLPFLDKVTDAAKSLPAPARAELESLLSGEKARWQRIRELVSGAPGAAAPNVRSGANSDLNARAAPPAPPPAPSLAGQPALDGRTFTVGVLRRRG